MLTLEKFSAGLAQVNLANINDIASFVNYLVNFVSYQKILKQYQQKD